MRRDSPFLPLLVAAASTLAAPAASAQEGWAPRPEAEAGFRSVHPPPPPWLAERFERTLAAVREPGFRGPKANPELVRLFLYETYEHVREVNTLVEALGGRSRALPGQAPTAARDLRGIHDFGERISVARLEAFVERVRARPLTTFEGKPVPVPAWLTELVASARASGAHTVDNGKLSPYVAAGLARNGNVDPYAIELHRLSAHHAHQVGSKAPRGPVLAEVLADKINAMRQVRVYKAAPMPFEKIGAILRADLGKGLPADAGPLVERALATQARLERTGRVNPYHRAEARAGRATRLARYRRADGTLDWGRAGRAGALHTAGGLAHFGLALFLKELAVVAQTGDPARIEEFFEGLATTDFYLNYGLFALGAQAGNVAYGAYLQRFVRPRFVSGILRTNLVLATGLALPQLVSGTFEGKAFAISFGALGLSSAAVRAGAAGLRWVTDLARAREAGVLGRAGARAKLLARAGGWFYTVAELAVILYLADDLEERIHALLDERAASEALGDAGLALLDAAADPGATPESIRAAAEEHHQVWTSYRDSLFGPLLADEARLSARLTKLAREAKLAADRRAAALERLRGNQALAARVTARHGSLEAYAEAAAAEDERALGAEVDRALATYRAQRDRHLEAAYAEGRRGTPLLAGVEVRHAGDPARTDLFARLGRALDRSRLARALGRLSRNRLETYEDEAAVLEAARDRLLADGRTDAADALTPLLERARRLHTLDRRLYEGGPGPVEVTGAGATTVLKRVGAQD